MLPETGPLIAGPDVPALAWVHSLPQSRHPLVLDPASERGWFGGTSLVLVDPCVEPYSVRGDESIDVVGTVLEEAMAGTGCAAAAAVLDYEPCAWILRYRGGLILTPSGWRLFGDVDPESFPPSPTVRETSDSPVAAAIRRDMDPRAFTDGIERVRDSIAAGDVYVLNLTYRLRGTSLMTPAETYSALRRRGHGDMSAALISPSRSLISVSPERFLSIDEDRLARIQPIKGTRPRGRTEEDDAALRDELVASAKESAEHVMIVDMERNDLGRVAVPGSVTVDPLKEVIPTPYCHQMVSTVSGKLHEDATIAQAIRATFPCGSVTGAPKIAAMNHINALEHSPRGSYTGSLFVALNGVLDSSVLIRTAEMSRGSIRYGVGAGITFDSDPHEEYVETVIKAVPITGDSTPSIGLRETCRVVRGAVPLLGRHLARLASGGCGPAVLAEVMARAEEALRSAVSRRDAARLRITVTPGGTVQAVLDSEPSSLAVQGGPTFHLASVVGAPELPESAAKPANRTPWDTAQKEALGAGCDQAILVDMEGNVIDGATASVWVVFGDRLFTPPAPPAVAGVARGFVLDKAGALGLRAEVAHVRDKDILDADEVIFTNAYAGAVAAFGRSGAVAKKLKQLFDEIWESA